MYCIIYLLSNDINKKVYVGQTWQSLKKRWLSGYKNSQHIGNAIDKYGKEHFYYTLLTVCATQEIANYWEDYFIRKYDSIENGYNLKGGGSKGKLSASIRARISNARIGTHWGHHSEETKKKMSLTKLGKICSDEHKENISLSKSGTNNPWYGKTRSEETKKKMSESKIGKTPSKETKKKMSESKKGKPRSEKTKQKISDSLKGENGPNAKLSNMQRAEIIEKRKLGIPIKTLMEEYSVCKLTIIRVSKNS
jgi:group I intron endonuclease